MRKMVTIVGIIFLQLALPHTLGAQTKSINIAGAELSLGMSKQEVIRELTSTGYELRQHEDGKGFSIISKKGPPFDHAGSLTLKDGKVWWIGKDWGTFQGADVISLFKAVFSVLSNTKKEEMVAVIRLWTHSGPGFESRNVDIFVSQEKGVSVYFSEHRDHAPVVSVQEQLQGD